MTVLLATAITAAVAFAYVQVRRATVAGARERLEGVSKQLTDIFASSMHGTKGQIRRDAQKPELREFLLSPTAKNRSAAQAALEALGAKTTQTVDVQLLDNSGASVLSNGRNRPPLSAAVRAELLAPLAPGDSSRMGSLHMVADTPAFAKAAPVTENGRTLGYLVERSRLSASAHDARAISDLIGSGAGVFIGNAGRDLWSDFWIAVDGPPIPSKPGQILEYERHGGTAGPKYALEKAVAGTPWLLLLELPRDKLLAPVRIFLRNATLFALLLLVAGAIGLWLVSHNMMRPLGQLREAAIGIAAGDYSKRLDLHRNDELGELGGAFDTMARQIAEAQRSLESHFARMSESEARYRKISEASFDGIDVVVDGVVREANRGFAEIFGYTVDEIVGRPVTDFIADESLPDVELRAAEMSEGTFEVVGKHKSGRRIILEATTRLHTFGGREGRIGAVRDVTEKRSLQGQVSQAQKMDAVGRLAGGVAHDFNNLLTVILSCADFQLTDLAEDAPQREDIEQIRAAALTAASLTRQLLAFSRQEVIRPRLIEVNSVVTTAEGILKRLIGEDILLTVLLSPENPVVKIDRGQLEQIVVNLAVNARDAMPQGGKLTIETQTLNLDEGYASTHWSATPGKYAVLAVTDSGSGMDEQTRSRIFEPFYTTKEAGKGTGLGLAMVYAIVKQSGGFIWVYSELGNGTVFRIYLPVADQGLEEESPRPLSAAEARGTETILVAEDSAAVRNTALQILQRSGYTVLEAPNGKSALDLARKRAGKIHLLLTDVVMPEMSGRELAEEFVGLRPGVRVIFMSGYTDDAVVRHGVLSASIEYIQKPFSPDSLLRKVREVLDAAL
jgi:PAS domain S-box-containing protein